MRLEPTGTQENRYRQIGKPEKKGRVDPDKEEINIGRGDEDCVHKCC